MCAAAGAKATEDFLGIRCWTFVFQFQLVNFYPPLPEEHLEERSRSFVGSGKATVAAVGDPNEPLAIL